MHIYNELIELASSLMLLSCLFSTARFEMRNTNEAVLNLTILIFLKFFCIILYPQIALIFQGTAINDPFGCNRGIFDVNGVLKRLEELQKKYGIGI